MPRLAASILRVITFARRSSPHVKGNLKHVLSHRDPRRWRLPILPWPHRPRKYLPGYCLEMLLW